MLIFYCNASILFQKKAVGHVTWHNRACCAKRNRACLTGLLIANLWDRHSVTVPCNGICQSGGSIPKSGPSKEAKAKKDVKNKKVPEKGGWGLKAPILSRHVSACASIRTSKKGPRRHFAPRVATEACERSI